MEAYNLYLKGSYALDRDDQTGYEEAVADFQQVLRMDPTFARAAVGLIGALIGQIEAVTRRAPRGRMFARLRSSLPDSTRNWRSRTGLWPCSISATTGIGRLWTGKPSSHSRSNRVTRT